MDYDVDIYEEEIDNITLDDAVGIAEDDEFDLEEYYELYDELDFNE